MTQESLTLAKQYLHRWFRGKVPFAEQEKAFHTWYLCWKPQHDELLKNEPFDKDDAEELAHDFFLEMEAWRTKNPEFIQLDEEALWRELNHKYFLWLIGRRMMKKNRLAHVCDTSMIDQHNRQVSQNGEKAGGRLVADYEETPAPKPEVPKREREFLPAQEWLEAAGTWRFHLVAKLFHEVKKGAIGPDKAFEVFMLATKSPIRREQLKPMAQRLLLAHEGKRLDAKIMTAFGLHSSGAKKLRSRLRGISMKEERRKAEQAYRQALLDLEREEQRVHDSILP